MAGYFDATYGDRNSNNSVVNDDEYTRMMASFNSYQPQQTPVTTSSAADNQKGVAAGTATGAAAGSAGGPVGAGIGAAAGFMTALMAQKAQDERQRRATAAQIEQNHAQNQNQGYETMMRGFQGALR